MHAFQLFRSIAVVAVVLFSLSAQASEPMLRSELPERWQYSGEYVQTLPCEDGWWRTFNDPVLDSLIVMAVNNNYNIVAAMHRVEAARNSIKQVQAGYYPTVGLQGGWNKSRTSGAIDGRSVAASTGSYFNLGANLNWEIDIFGKVRAKARESKASYQATRAEYAAAMVSLCSEMASYYMQLRTLQEELLVARIHIESQDSVLTIVNVRHEAGLNSKLDVTQARTIYYSTLASVPGLQAQIECTVNAIALLIGREAPLVKRLLSEPQPLPDYHQIVSAGIPSELLRRRPDVVEAECAVAQSAASLGIAKKDFLPTLALTGSVGVAAHNAGDMFRNNSFEYAVAPTLSWTVFDGFSRRSGVAQAREMMEANIANYNSVVLTAVEEVNNAMINYTYCLKNIDYLNQVVKEAEESLRLAVELYRGGLSSFTNVADAQISYLQYADNLVTARGSAVNALISLYKALGGGWSEIER